MRYRDSQLIGAPVFTESGAQVGKLAGFTIDAENHEVIQYAVRKSSTLQMILPKEFLVNQRQVISISEEKVIIKDAAITEGVEESVAIKSRKSVAKPAGLQRSSE